MANNVSKDNIDISIMIMIKHNDNNNNDTNDNKNRNNNNNNNNNNNDNNHHHNKLATCSPRSAEEGFFGVVGVGVFGYSTDFLGFLARRSATCSPRSISCGFRLWGLGFGVDEQNHSSQSMFQKS